MGDTTEQQSLTRLPLDQWHRARGARMVPFAGYEMSVQFDGIIAEHLWTRERAGLFDVSHMGQIELSGADADKALERLVPGDVQALKPGRMRYSLLLDAHGGILDDLMITRTADGAIALVVNGATKWDDIAHLREHLPDEVGIRHAEELALLALQGPAAAAVLGALIPNVARMRFMDAASFNWNGIPLAISRSGYTGEDGFEISVPAERATQLADALTDHPATKPVGLGARDSLRLEAGLPLYGHDLDSTVTPATAGLGFAVGKRRRAERNFAGAQRVLEELEQGSPQVRVGLAVEGRQPVREGATIVDAQGETAGRITSGGFSPSLGRPIAMGYVAAGLASPGSTVTIEQRGKHFTAEIVPLPFVPHRYHRQGAR